MNSTTNEKSTAPRESAELKDSTDKWTHAKYREYLVTRIQEQKKLLEMAQTIPEHVVILECIDVLTDRLYQLDIKTRRVKFIIGDKEF